MKKGKITFLIPILGIGGAERVTVDISAGLLLHYSDIEIVTNELKGGFIEEVKPEIKLRALDTFSPLLVPFRLRRYFNKHRPAVVIAQGTRMSVTSSLAMLIPGYKPALIWCMHNPYSTKQGIYSKPIAWIVTKLVTFLANQPKQITGVSEGVTNSLLSYIGSDFREKTITLHNPIPPFSGKPYRRDAKREQKKIIAAGRLAHQKNFEHLIATMPLILEEIDSTLHIYGTGPLQDELLKQIESLNLKAHVFLEGFSRNVRQNMAEADVFVLSSRWEGLPTVLIEAMSTGVPVVSTNCNSGPDEILEGGKWGKLVAENNIREFADSIVDILKNGGVDPRPRAKDFEPTQVIKRYLDLISKVS